jgi:DNA polymerase-3 subunit delta
VEYAEVVDRIKQGRVAPAYLLCGPQSFMIEAVVAALRDAVEAGKHGTFASETFHGDEDNGSRIAAAAREIPMLVPRRLLVVREAQGLAGRPESVDALVAYLEQPSPTTILALTAAAFDARTRLARKIAEVGVVLRAEKVAPRELAPFVRNHGRALGVELAGDAVAALLDACGDDLTAIHDGVSKLALYVEEGRPATTADVQAVVAPSRQHSVFELVDAIGARDTARAFELVQRLSDQGEAPLKVLGLFGRQIRQLIDVKSDRVDSPRLAGLPPFVRDKIKAQGERFSLRDLVRALEALHRTDLALKSSKREGERVLEALVLEIAGAPTGRATRRRPPA